MNNVVAIEKQIESIEQDLENLRTGYDNWEMENIPELLEKRTNLRIKLGKLEKELSMLKREKK